jgi:hypothetical protein
MQYQAYIVGLSQAVRRQARTLLPCEREETRLGIAHGTQLDEAEARGAGEVARWRSYVGLYKQRFRLQLGEICGQFIGTIGWIERGACGTGNHGEKGHGHLCAVWEHEHNPILAANTHGTQCPQHMLDVLP